MASARRTARAVPVGMGAVVIALLLAAASVFVLRCTAQAVDAPAPSSAVTLPPADTSAVGELRRQAAALVPLVRTKAAQQFLRATASLPHIATRVLWSDSSRTRWYDERAAAALPESERARLVARPVDERFYYHTRYGTPLAYARALDLAASGAFPSFAGLRVLDFGYGGIGQLRLLATVGAQAVGVEVDPMLPVFYSAPGDTGAIPGPDGMPAGSVRLVHGRFPADPAAHAAVGGGYDLIVSKNVLKRGYLHPSRPADKRILVDLGVDDSTFVRALHDALAPGGRVIVYNVSPAPSPPEEPFRPWTDGHDPFARALWERAGFRVLAYDLEDSEAARAQGRALAWDAGPSPMDLEGDLFAHYTLLEKPR